MAIICFYKMRVEEANLVKRICDLEIRKNTFKESLYHVYAKINWMYEYMDTLTADDSEPKENGQNISS